ncbi:ribosome assembly factor SBDS [archaeon]|jgi:ribosome maturation protein SDO1|nr:ribosome assembly factor SBDS [archaeon]MBT7128135.1 ribosome assembly factor SBDS [archaeon]
MVNTTARVKKGGKHYEVLVDLDEALKVAKGDGNLNTAVLNDAVFHNLKSGERASVDDLEAQFGTSVFEEVAEKVIRNGEVVRTADSMNKDQDLKYKQVVDFLVRNAVSPEGRPYTPDRIMKALKEAHVNVKNKPVESQVEEILDQLGKVLPLSIERKKVKLLIPAIHSGKAYGIIKEFMIKEDWKNNGDLEVLVEVPSGLLMDFYDKVNSATSGSVMSEEVK